jgi:hypothetical protein
VKSFREIAEHVQEIVRHYDGEDIVIWDVGGYAAQVMSDAPYAMKIRYAVEDTNNGLWIYQNAHLRRPVIEVASIENKRVENAFVGRRIVDGIEKHLAEFDSGFDCGEVVVVGFGGIGQSVCSALCLKGINCCVVEICVVEIDERKLAIADAMGHRVARSISHFSEAKIVIGCTGKPSVKLADLGGSDGAFLFSGSSKQIEFADVLANEETTTRGKFVVANEGKPINFRYGSLDPQISDFMYANIIGAIIEGDDKVESIVHKLSDSWQEKICQAWTGYYLTHVL